MLKNKYVFLAPAFLVITGIAGITSLGANWNQVWNDEFDGSSLNLDKWSYETGNKYNGWGNNELQYYTEGANCTVSDGILTITAKKREKRRL